MKQLVIITLLANSLIAMQPVPTPTGTTPMQVEGAQQPTPEKQFVFHQTKALIKTTSEQYKERMEQEASKVDAYEAALKEENFEKAKKIKKTIGDVPLNLYQQVVATKVPEEKESRIINALKKNDLELFKQAIASEKVDRQRFSSLLDTAIDYNNLPVVKYLLSRAENIPQETFKNAFNNCSYTIAPFLLDKAFSQKELKQAPLHAAIIKNDFEKVIALIKDDKDINEKISFGKNKYFQNMSPLHIASLYGQTTIAQLLIEKGANVNAQDNDGWTPLHVASRNGYIEIAKLLIENGANVNAQANDDLTPLHLVENRELAQLLIENGAYVEARADYGFTPLHFASDNNYIDVAKLLIKKGANVNAQNNDERTPLHEASLSGSIDVAKLLIKNGVDVNAQDVIGETPLHGASLSGSIEIATLLIKNGADVNAQSVEGWTPLHVASWSGYIEIAKLLIKNGADVNAQNKRVYAGGGTPLHEASKSGYIDVAKLLIKKGANVNAQDNSDATPLHYASRSGIEDIVRLLLTAGADRSVKNKNGETALAIARSQGHEKVARLLIFFPGLQEETQTKVPVATRVRELPPVTKRPAPMAQPENFVEDPTTAQTRALQSDDSETAVSDLNNRQRRRRSAPTDDAFIKKTSYEEQ